MRELVTSVRPYCLKTYRNPSTDKQIVIKFYIWDFNYNLSILLHFGWNGTELKDILHAVVLTTRTHVAAYLSERGTFLEQKLQRIMKHIFLNFLLVCSAAWSGGHIQKFEGHILPMSFRQQVYLKCRNIFTRLREFWRTTTTVRAQNLYLNFC
jgi:hypothetical protein